MRKTAVIAAVHTALEAELRALVAAASLALDEATSEESKAENKYDTRSLEASYLAGAQSERTLALKQVIAFWNVFQPRDYSDDQPIGVGALVGLADARGERWCLLAPSGGGRRVSVDGREITVVDPRTPLGRALVGAAEGDEVEVRTPQGLRALEVTSVH